MRDTVSTDRLRGLRIFDITDIRNPRNVGNVQTCRGSHTHTVASDPRDPRNVYIYVSGSSRVRSPSELPGCSDRMPEEARVVSELSGTADSREALAAVIERRPGVYEGR